MGQATTGSRAACRPATDSHGRSGSFVTRLYRGAGIRTRDLLLPKLKTGVDRRQPPLICLHLAPCPANQRRLLLVRAVTGIVTVYDPGIMSSDDSPENPALPRDDAS